MLDFAVIPGTNDEEAIVISQDGLLQRLSLPGAFAPQFFGDISGIVNCCGEEGLLSIAFSPNFTSDGRVYLYYTRSDAGDACSGSEGRCSFVSRFAVHGNEIDSGPEVMLEIDQFASNHNGGKLLFGGDGMLYLGLGDGGGVFDSEDNGQNKNTLLGTVIRIDVSGAGGYTIPADNPFVDEAMWGRVRGKRSISSSREATTVGCATRVMCRAIRTQRTARLRSRWCFRARSMPRTGPIARSLGASCTGDRSWPSWTGGTYSATTAAGE
jgi:hypothetical protein